MEAYWTVTIRNHAVKRVKKMPQREQQKLMALLKDLKIQGAVLPQWPNYSKLGENRYHCHLSYKWVACWEIVKEEIKLIDVYYVGSREDAPY